MSSTKTCLIKCLFAVCNEYKEVLSFDAMQKLIPFNNATSNFTNFQSHLKHLSVEELDKLVGVAFSELSAKHFDDTSFIDTIENLFFTLDVRGCGYVRLDDMTVLMLALHQETISNQTEQTLLQSAASFLSEIGPFHGIVSLQKFKQFFYNNKLQLQDITSTAENLRQDIHLLRRHFINTSDSQSLLQHACSLCLKETDADMHLFFSVHVDSILQTMNGMMFSPEAANIINEEFCRIYGKASNSAHLIRAVIQTYKQLIQRGLESIKKSKTKQSEDNHNVLSIACATSLSSILLNAEWKDIKLDSVHVTPYLPVEQTIANCETASEKNENVSLIAKPSQYANAPQSLSSILHKLRSRNTSTI